MNESVIKTIGVAFAVCLVCSLIVSASAVSLREQQKENKLNDRRVKILEVADIKIEPDQTVAEAFKKLEQKFNDFNKDLNKVLEKHYPNTDYLWEYYDENYIETSSEDKNVKWRLVKVYLDVWGEYNEEG